MRKAFFVKDVHDIDKYLPPLSGDTLVVHSDYYQVNTQYPTIGFIKFSASYTNYTPDNIILVGLNRIRTPERRYDLVFPYLYNMNKFETKITIDEKPFNGEPWRAWYHFGFLYGKWLDLSYSNAVESDWSHWFYRDTEDSIISAKSISDKITDVYSDLDKLVTSFEFYDPDERTAEYYENLKEEAFNKYSTPKHIIQMMMRNLCKYTGIELGFETYLKNKTVSLPDFPIMRFMAEENMRRMDIYNTIISTDEKNIQQ